MVDPLNIGPMQAARLLPAIKQNKDAARSRFMEIETHNCANFRRFARVTHFAERAQSNSVTNLERVHITACNQYLYLFWHIPRSRHNPKILGVDDAEIVGDRITEVRPIPRNFFTQETERRI